MLTSDPDRLQLTVGTDSELAVSGREIGDYASLRTPEGEEPEDVRIVQNGDQPVAPVSFTEHGVYEIEADGDTRSVAVVSWLEQTAGWHPLHHLEQLTAARARALLDAGADIHQRPSEGGPTPLERATELHAAGQPAAEGSPIALVLAAAASDRVHGHVHVHVHVQH